MNHRVRAYLIDVARQPDKFVYYSDLVNDCNLNFDLATNYGQRQLSGTLEEVSAYEHSYGRPLISAFAIYKDKRKNDHGEGFYRLAESLGYGTAKDLRERLFGFEEAEKCRRFWQNNGNFEEFGSPKGLTSTDVETVEFFISGELEFFKQWQKKPYDPEDTEHVEAKEYLMDTVWEKSIYLGRQIISTLDGFALDGKKYWSQRGWKEIDGSNIQAAVFKPYTWVKVFREVDRGKDIYFTFGVDADLEAFILKIDCRDNRDSTLSREQIFLCRNLIPESAKRNKIDFDELLKLNWRSLTDICVQFVTANLAYYDAIIRAVWEGQFQPTIFKNCLIKRDKPADAHTVFPETERKFKGVDIDFSAKSKEQKDLGDAGEKLVKKFEVDFLTSINKIDEAAKVEIVLDGKGYDVLSFDEIGNPKYIEIKTTAGDKYVMFHLTSNEVAFMQGNIGSYSLYRVYNYDEENNFGEFFEISNDVKSQLLMTPDTFKVLLKGETNESAVN